MFEIEKTDDGVWAHTTHPETGKRISIYVNLLGSSDGIIVDLWREGLKTAEVREEDECINSIGWEWCELDLDEATAPSSTPDFGSAIQMLQTAYANLGDLTYNVDERAAQGINTQLILIEDAIHALGGANENFRLDAFR